MATTLEDLFFCILGQAETRLSKPSTLEECVFRYNSDEPQVFFEPKK